MILCFAAYVVLQSLRSCAGKCVTTFEDRFLSSPRMMITICVVVHDCKRNPLINCGNMYVQVAAKVVSC